MLGVRGSVACHWQWPLWCHKYQSKIATVNPGVEHHQALRAKVRKNAGLYLVNGTFTPQFAKEGGIAGLKRPPLVPL